MPQHSEPEPSIVEEVLHPERTGPPLTDAATPAARRRHRRWAGGVLVAAGTVIGGLAVAVRTNVQAVVGTDRALAVAATDLLRPHPQLTHALIVWQEMTQPRWLYIAATALCVWWWRRHARVHGARLVWGFCTLMVAWSSALALKYIVQRARPEILEPLELAPGYSFPSGHAANAAAVATGLVLIAWPLVRPAARRWLVVAGVALAVITGVDRILLGVHFLSDVVAGWVFGTACVGTSYLLFRQRIHRADDPHLRPDESASA